MKLVQITDLRINDNRIRKRFDDDALAELCESIRTHGLLHAVVYRETESGPELIAGERRLRAITQLAAAGTTIRYDGGSFQPGVIPCVTLGELSVEEALAVEYEENIIRRDITWQERVAAEERLHAIKVSLNPTHTFADTAKIVYGENYAQHAPKTIKRDVLLAQHLHDPDVAAAKTPQEAVKIARRKLEAELVDELSKRINITNNTHQLYNEDCVSWLAGAPANFVDCVITDPPYGIGADSFTKQSGQQDFVLHTYEDTEELATGIVHALANTQAMKHDSHIWMFCDIRHFVRWATVFREAGWYVWPHPVIWDKNGIGALMGNANGPRHTYECILFAQRGAKPFKHVVPDVLRIKPDMNKEHAAQKPVELYTALMKLSCDPGDVVLDICCGSGTIFPAASECKLSAIGLEIDQHSYNLAKTRLETK